MPWYYVEAGAQKGPLDDEAFKSLVASGTIRAETLVWREGMKDWTPYATVAGAGGASGPAPASLAPGQVACGECGRAVPEAETVEIGGRRICATCKPGVVQRMIEGTASGAGGLDPEGMLSDLRSQGGYSIDIGAAISAGWEVVRGNFWPCIGVNFLAFLILAASGQVPCIGVVATLLLTGPITGGLLNYFLLQVRGQPATIHDAFIGFKVPLGKELMLAGLVQQLIQGVVMLTVIGPFFALGMLADQGGTPEVPVWVLVAMPFAIAAALFTYLIWYPSYVILADTGIGFWKGMELSRRLVMMRFFTWVGLMLMLMLVGIAGVLALCVGVFVAMPVINASYAAVWEQIHSQADAVRQARAGATM